MANQIQAGPLTRGHVLAEALAGCSSGVAFSVISSLVWTVEPISGSAAAVHHFSILSTCLMGGVIAASIHGLIELFYIGREYFDPYGALETRVPMVYPPTPGKIY
ncbi:hypothetical protein TI03_03185 [Achromatium sp. WMS1]|nr:hypothetical protein TI03_03185 [Achromatium sp. WMS1]